MNDLTVPAPEVSSVQCAPVSPTSPGAGPFSPAGIKICRKCGAVRELSDFRVVCLAKGTRRLRAECRFCESARASAWNKRHPELHRKLNYAWNSRHPEYASRQQRARRKACVRVRLAHNLRTRLNAAIRKAATAGSAVRDLGCSIPELKSYLEDKFLPGMGWHNWGRGLGCWNIDHIVPFDLVDVSDREILLKAVHYSNLRPLWFSDNLRRKNPAILDAELRQLGLLQPDGQLLFPVELDTCLVTC